MPDKTIVKRVPQLQDLCHDTLAKGVITKHGKLPASWLDLFQNDGAVMNQLKDFVLERVVREDYLHTGSTVALEYMYYSASDIDDGTRPNGIVNVPATALPKWFFALLEAWFQVHYHCDPLIEWPEYTDAGGYELYLSGPEKVLRLWRHMVAWARDKNPPTKKVWHIYNKLVHKLIAAFEIDVPEAYADRMKNASDPEFFSALPNHQIIDEFAVWTRKLLMPHLKKRIQEDLTHEWWRKMQETYDDTTRTAAYKTAPFVTLTFNFLEGWEAYFDEKPASESESDHDDEGP